MIACPSSLRLWEVGTTTQQAKYMGPIRATFYMGLHCEIYIGPTWVFQPDPRWDANEQADLVQCCINFIYRIALSLVHDYTETSFMHLCTTLVPFLLFILFLFIYIFEGYKTY